MLYLTTHNGSAVYLDSPSSLIQPVYVVKKFIRNNIGT